jgi:hypothetical protein
MRDGVPGFAAGNAITAFDVDGTMLGGQLGRPLLRSVLDAGLVSRAFRADRPASQAHGA